MHALYTPIKSQFMTNTDNQPFEVKEKYVLFTFVRSINEPGITNTKTKPIAKSAAPINPIAKAVPAYAGVFGSVSPNR